MPQISLYVDTDTLAKIEQVARQEHVSVSRWVRESLQRVLADSYPSRFFTLFGSITDDTFERPQQLQQGNDVSRESL